MNKDIADNVLKKGKEGIKENFIEVFSEFADEYADEMWLLVNELIRLRKENQILREEKTPKKPTSLIEYTRIKDELRSKIDYIHEQDEIIKGYKDKIESGKLISTVQGEQGEQEIAFFVAHNAAVRKRAIEEFASILEMEFLTDWQHGAISEGTYNFIISEIQYVLSLEGYKK